MSDRRTLALQLATAGLAAVLLLVVYGGPRGFGQQFDVACPTLACDYVRHFHPTAVSVLSGGGPTDGYLYPPTLALMSTPLALLNERLAGIFWVAAQGLITLAWCVVPPHLTGSPATRRAVLYTLAATLSMPVLQVVKWGQVGVLLATLSLAAFVLLQRRRDGFAGALLGLASALKLYPVMWVVWPLFLLRRRAAASFAAVAALLLFVLPGVVLGADGTASFYVQVMSELERVHPFVENGIGSQYLPAVFIRWTGLEMLREPLALGMALAVLGLFTALPRLRGRPLLAWTWLAACLPLLVETSWLHYFVHLPVGWWVLAETSTAQSGPRRTAGTAALAGSVAVSSWPFFLLVSAGKASDYADYGWLSAANLALLIGLGLTLPRADS